MNKVKDIATKINSLAENLRVQSHLRRSNDKNELYYEIELIAEAILKLAAVVRFKKDKKYD